MATIGAIVLMGCGRTHAREPDPLPCGGEPLVLGASAAIEEQPAVVIVGGGSTDFVAWRAPETIEVRAIGRHGRVTAARSWERVRAETPWNVGPPQLFLS